MEGRVTTQAEILEENRKVMCIPFLVDQVASLLR
jgi:hypothetical protein